MLNIKLEEKSNKRSFKALSVNLAELNWKAKLIS